MRVLTTLAIAAALALLSSAVGADDAGAPGAHTPDSSAPAANAPEVKEFKYEGSARKHCPKDAVVWGNAENNVYDMKGAKDYGTGQDGKYVCMGEAKAAGWHDAKDKKNKK